MCSSRQIRAAREFAAEHGVRRHRTMLRPVPKPADRAAARRNARAVAAAIDGRVSTNHRLSLDEPRCPYVVRWNLDDFWFGVRISDDAYVVRSNAKDRFSSILAYCGAFKVPDLTMDATLELKNLGQELGVRVYVAGEGQSQEASRALRANRARALIGAINFDRVRRFFFSPAQLWVIADLSSPTECAQQVQIMRDLQVALRNGA